MEELKVERSYGGFYCIFHIGEQEYIGSLIIRTDLNYIAECVIFKSKDGQFSFNDALGECMARGIPYSPESLRECITDFIQGQNGKAN